MKLNRSSNVFCCFFETSVGACVRQRGNLNTCKHWMPSVGHSTHTSSQLDDISGVHSFSWPKPRWILPFFSRDTHSQTSTHTQRTTCTLILMLSRLQAMGELGTCYVNDSDLFLCVLVFVDVYLENARKENNVFRFLETSILHWTLTPSQEKKSCIPL